MSADDFPSWAHYDEYDQLYYLLTSKLTGIEGNFAGMRSPDLWSDLKNEQRLISEVCRLTGITPAHWERLSQPERCPWLERAIDALSQHDAAQDEPSDDGGAQLDDESARILLALKARDPTLLSIPEIVAGTEIEDDKGRAVSPALSAATVKGRVRELIERGYIHRPKGQNSGAGLTAAGHKLAGKLHKSQPAQS